MGSLIRYAVIGVLAALSVFAVVLGLIRSSGTPRKKLLRSVLLLSAVALLCFGGDLVLSRMGMGWRCTPRNTMLFLCGVLLVVTPWRCMHALNTFGSGRPIFQVCGTLSLALVMILSLFWTAGYFTAGSWHDRLALYDGQSIVCATDMNGGSGEWRYYAHINDLVHGAEIVHDGSWWGTPPFRT